MRLIQVNFDDEEAPRDFTVSMALDEVALLYRLTGHIPPQRITDISGNVRWGDALWDLADGAGAILNRFYEDGPDGVIPRFDAYQIKREQRFCVCGWSVLGNELERQNALAAHWETEEHKKKMEERPE